MYFFSRGRQRTRLQEDWSSDTCSSDLGNRWTIDGGWALTLREGRWNSLYVIDEWDTPLVGTKAVLTLGYRID